MYDTINATGSPIQMIQMEINITILVADNFQAREKKKTKNVRTPGNRDVNPRRVGEAAQPVRQINANSLSISNHNLHYTCMSSKYPAVDYRQPQCLLEQSQG